ncbi:MULTISPECIES: hypothetical protein [Kordiimonas]|uniref:hypothetical protein n=1 Tax=Kordiimonas TaxID=288021 RepID=UPI00257CA2F8|nr:hypothetical protein [Kordiimonas sp. UBA4487]
MAKKKALEDSIQDFERLLESPFKWPSQGDLPFVERETPLDNANVAANWFARLVLMTQGYKKAADISIDYVRENLADRDLLVFSIIFNYRQFLELSLKYFLATYGPQVGVQPNWAKHDLRFLWEEFLKLLDAYGTPDPDEADPVVGEIIAEFAKIDPQSYSFRYPVDKNGSPLPLAYSDLHLETLAEVMEKVSNYFQGCDGYLSNMEILEP